MPLHNFENLGTKRIDVGDDWYEIPASATPAMLRQMNLFSQQVQLWRIRISELRDMAKKGKFYAEEIAKLAAQIDNATHRLLAEQLQAWSYSEEITIENIERLDAFSETEIVKAITIIIQAMQGVQSSPDKKKSSGSSLSV